MLKFMLILFAVLPDQLVPVSIGPHVTMADCRKALAKEVAVANAQGLTKVAFIAECLPIENADKLNGPTI